MEITAYIAAAFIGLSLGLIGGGGSILTVPVLVYLFGINPLLATSYSLFIVGSTSFVGAFFNYLKGLVKIKIGLAFGLTSVITVFLIRKFVTPFVGEISFTLGGFHFTGQMLTLILFAALMVAAASSMIKDSHITNPEASPRNNLFWLLIYGLSIGIITGLLGAGGGFLLIPALVLLIGLPMKEAVGTSLFIIALNSLIGFTGDLGHFNTDWIFLLKVTAMAIGGIFAGVYVGKIMDGERLKKGFGWFILLMGIYIISVQILQSN